MICIKHLILTKLRYCDYIQLCMLVQYFQNYEARKWELEDKNSNETETETDNSTIKKNIENLEKYNGWFPAAHRCCN